MPADFYLKLKKYNNEQNAKADGNICKKHDNSAKADLKAVTSKEDSYYDHLMEWCVWRRNWLN